LLAAISCGCGGGNGLGPRPQGDPWENPWYKIGRDTDKNNTPLYIKKAFQIADQYAPGIKLIYNHHENPEMDRLY
jgi:hypothetical protein